ncbi:MAG: aldo/keto reductase [Steroidobacteraceae bacterium]
MKSQSASHNATNIDIRRRTFIEKSTLAGLSLLLGGQSTSAATKQAVIRKVIPASGEQIPVMGAGASFFSNLSVRDVQALLKNLYDQGGTVIDTAAYYGSGGSERFIGEALQNLKIRKKIFISTKFNAVGHDFGEGDTIHGAESFERSLKNLRTDYVDLLEVHKPSGAELLMPLMQRYKREGRARYIGVTTWLRNEHELLVEYMRKYPLDFIQVDYSLGNRHAAETILPLAKERGMAVMVNVPLGGVGDSLMRRVSGRPLPDWAVEIGASSWSQLFLKYVVSHPAVTCAIPGSTKLEHLLDNQQAGLGVLPDAGVRKRMESYWDNFN